MAKAKKNPTISSRKKTSARSKARSAVTRDDHSDEEVDDEPMSPDVDLSQNNELVDKRRHQLPSMLEEASDEEEELAESGEEGEDGFGEDDTKISRGATAQTFSPSQVKSCVADMKKTPNVRTFRNLADTFVALANQVAGDVGNDDNIGTAHTLFNYMLKECLQEFVPKLRRLTRLDTLQTVKALEVTSKQRKSTARESADASINQQVRFLRTQSPEWRQLRVKLRGYFLSILQVLDAALVSSSNNASKLQRMQHRQQQQVQRIIFRHIVALLPFYLASAKCSKLLVQTFIRFWSESDDEDVRLLVFVSITRIIRHSIGAAAQTDNESDAADAVTLSSTTELLQMTVKRMYAAFLASSKDTSVESMPGIQFMQHSLVELLSLQPQAVYELAFTSIRQLASTLRNAILAKSQPNGSSKISRHGPDSTRSSNKAAVPGGKRRIRGDKSARGHAQKDRAGSSGGVRDYQSAVKQVYSWPFVHAATLWCRLLARHQQDPLLGQLVHPITQTIQGSIALEPSARNLPVRYHFIRALTLLVSGTHGKLFVPLMSNAILTPLVAPWSQSLLSKTPSRVGYKPHNWRVMLKLSEAQLKEDGARDMLIDAIHDACMEYLGVTCHLLSFPECMQMPLAQLRTFAKSPTALRCPQLAQVMKLLKRHIVENVDFILNVRRRYFAGSDIRKIGDQVQDVEKCLRLGTEITLSKLTSDNEAELDKRPPFAVYFDTWKEKRRDELTRHGIDAAEQSKAQTGGKPRAPPSSAAGRKKSNALRTGEDAVPSYAEMAAQRAQAKEDFMADLAAAADADGDDDEMFKPKQGGRNRKKHGKDQAKVGWADDAELNGDADEADEELLTIKKKVAL